ncbi:MAG TPA: hypothetical protein VGM33_10300 [Baekduia sp.]
MSTPEHPHAPGPAPVPLRCPRCGASVGPEQDWCLECGAPARTRLAPTPHWHRPIAVLCTIALIAGVALAVAFASLTNDDGTVSAATTAPVQPNETTSTPVAPPVSAPPAASSAVPGGAVPSSAVPGGAVPSSATPAG